MRIRDSLQNYSPGINRKCLQMFNEADMMEYGCSYSDCRHCGHNVSVAAKRALDIQINGLTLCADGKYRYIIRRRRKRNGRETA
jgi:hypothetical protein